MASSKSIMQDEKKCYICGMTRGLERHHVFGAAYRKKSDRLGLTVYLCHYHHNEPPHGVHHNRANMDWLRMRGQAAYMDYYGASKDDFIREFGRNYL